MNKEVTLVVLDLNQSFFEDQSNQLQIAIQCIYSLIAQQILYHKKSDHIGLVVVNSVDNEENKSIEKVLELDSGNFQMLRKLKEYYQSIESSEEQVSIYQGLLESGEILKNYSASFQKKIFLISNGANQESDQKIKSKIFKLFKDKNFKLNIIELNEGESQFDQLVKEFRENEIECKNFDYKSSLKILNSFKKEKVTNICQFKGNFEISPDLQLNVKIFSKTMEKKFPSLKKYSKLDRFSRDPNEGKINTKTIYLNPQSLDIKEVPKEDIVKGYHYGQQVITVDNKLQQEMKFTDDKCLKLMGFVDENQVNRAYLMSNVKCVLADKDESVENHQAFSAIVKGMLLLEKVGLARFVQKANKSPSLVVLYPIRKSKGKNMYSYMLYMSELPTVEDIREYTFGSLKKSTEEQRQLIKEYIRRLDIHNFEDEEGRVTELLNPQQTFNPHHQVFHDNVLARGLSENPFQQEILIRPEIDDYVHTERRTHPKIQDLEEDIKKVFDLKENEEKEEKKKKVYWSELLQDKQDRELLEQKMNGDKDDDVPKKISKNHPISDFKEMLNYRNEDLFDQAVKQMRARINEMIDQSVDGEHFDKAIECIKVLRESCIDEEEIQGFNNYLQFLKKQSKTKKNFEIFWKILKNHKITLISNEEFPSSIFTQRMASDFIQDDDYDIRQTQMSQYTTTIINELE